MHGEEEEEKKVRRKINKIEILMFGFLHLAKGY